jgi:hypothetical protein
MKNIWNKIISFFSYGNRAFSIFIGFGISFIMMVMTALCLPTTMIYPIMGLTATLITFVTAEHRNTLWGGKFDWGCLLTGSLPSLFFMIVFGILMAIA